MSARAQQIARRRAEVRRRRAAGESIRHIAAETGAAKSTVERDLAAPKPDAPLPAPPAGNTRALKGGWTSDRVLAPLREHHAGELLRRFPWLADDQRLALAADRLARIETATAWLDERGGIVRDAEGEVFAVVRELEKWATRTEQLLADLEREHRDRGGRRDSFTAFLDRRGQAAVEAEPGCDK